MECKKIEQLIDDYLMDSLSAEDAAEVEDHLSRCEHCRKIIEKWDVIRECIRREHRLSVDSVPQATLDTIYARARSRFSHRHFPFHPPLRDWLRQWWETPTLAWQAVRISSILVVGIVIGMFMFNQRGERYTPSFEATPPSIVPTSPVEVASVPGSSPETDKSDTARAAHFPDIEATPIKIIKSPLKTDVAEVSTKEDKQPLNIADTIAMGPLFSITELMTPEGSELPVVTSTEYSPEEVRTVAREIQGSMNNLQQIKLQLMLAGQNDSVSQIHQLEDSMLRLISMDTTEQKNQWTLLSQYQQAEEAVLSNDFMSALQLYYSVIAEEPNSYLAFLSHYQIATIQLNYLNNFGEALSEYQICLNSYPESYFSSLQRKDILEKVALLSENAVDNWRPLKLYLEAQKSNLDVGLILYKEILENYPQLSLAQKSAQKIIQSVLSSTYEDATVPNRVIRMFQESMGKIDDRTLDQQLQLGIADIMNYRLFNRRQALLEYTRTIQIDPQSAMAMAARQRSREIYDTIPTQQIQY